MNRTTTLFTTNTVDELVQGVDTGDDRLSFNTPYSGLKFNTHDWLPLGSETNQWLRLKKVVPSNPDHITNWE